ncbi:hypothetical protein QYE76_030911 [Lolium multiflorum]|uniref:RNase H type-1 domain-containing protein n=1 Tax=Lolium multiflorum TaxID=4521 RepID=A0AAD8QQL4_LOLMU|nr:hypothetical protein QYE76_030911 [Lolium multiflorum]
MLARQGWRLIEEPDSLCGQVLKAKYFPECSILEASSRPGISYSWRSILKGVALLKEGLVWRVGDGTNISAWKDPWLPDGNTRRPRTLQGQSFMGKVVDLINSVTGEWDEGIINDNFHPEDAKSILSISIGENIEDKLAWHFDPKGLFSVKSAYKLGVLLRDRKVRREASCSQESPSAIGNKANAGEVCSSPLEVCHRVEKLAVDFSFLNVPEKPPQPPDMKKWTRPPDDYVKINFYGAFDQTTNTGGWGNIIRDQAGDLVATGAVKSVHLRDALHSEVVACIAAIGGAIKTGANRINFESDSSNLTCLEFAAHELAKMGANSESLDSVWVDTAPSCVVNIMASDIVVYEV